MDNRISQLESLIPKYAKSYYSGESEVSDEYFDSLVDELRALSPESEVLKKTGWGYSPETRKVKHMYGLHIGSLPKIKSVSDIPERFIPRSTRISAKLDGLSVVSYYSAGKRILAVTRGNGTEGKDVTNKMRIIDPQTEELTFPFNGAIRGEVLIDNRTWDRIKSRYEDNPSANQRNVASGIMNRNDFEGQSFDPDLKLLRYVVYKVIAHEGYAYESSFRIPEISDQFSHVPYAWFDKDSWSQCEDLIISTLNEFKKTFPCDGLVLTKDMCTQTWTSGIEYDEVAYKIQAESKEVVVKEVTYNATRTGRLAPRVWFDPVELSGAIVKKATGFNAQFIKDNFIGPGAVIEVCRSGEVIPDIMKVITPASEPQIPSTCPRCGNEVRWVGVDLVCDSENEEQLAYRFISVLGETDGAGWSLFNKILELFKIDSLESLRSFILTSKGSSKFVNDKITSGVSGSSTQSKCVSVVNKICSDVSPVNFLVACNIGGISWTTAKSLMENYSDFINDVKEVKVDWIKVSNIKGFGYSTVVALQSAESRIKTLAEVMSFEKMTYENPVESKFKVAITGSLSIKRSDFDSLLESHGISQSGNFKEIRYLITNNPNSGSSKMKKAKDNGVEIISEEMFTKMYLES